MRMYAIGTGILAGLLLASGAQAQSAARVEGGLGLLGAVGGGSFSDQIEGALGVGANARIRLDSKGYVALRVDADWMSHGLDRTNVELRSPFGGTQSLDLNTINTVSFLQAGPELSARVRGVRPYIGATAGLAYFLTTAEGNREDEGTGFTMTVHKQDLAFAYGAQTGLRIPVRSTKRAIAVDLGVRYQRSGEAEFLRKGDLTVDESGVIHFSPVRSKAELWVFHAGVSVPLSLPKRGGDRD